MKFSYMMYEGFVIHYDVYGRGEYTIMWDGFEHIFWSLADAQMYIDQSLQWERRAYEEAESYLSEPEYSEDY